MVCGGAEEQLFVPSGQTTRRTGDEAGEVGTGQLWRTTRSHWRVLSREWHDWIFDPEWESANVFCKGPNKKYFRLCES